jgi:outer membrane protein assembly factor BamD
MNKKASLLVLGLILALFALASGCGFGFDSGGSPEAFDTPAQVLANEAETLYNEGEFDEAAELFQQLKDRYPYSRYALLADLRVADAYAKAGRDEEAVLAYDDFVRLHPKNEAVPYAIYKMGMVYRGQMLTPDRDPTNSKKAVDAFERLIKEYPNTEWAEKAKPRLKETLENLVQHEMDVGLFYFRTDRFRAAMGRFKRVISHYPDVGLYDEAMDYIQKCQVALAEKGEERDDESLLQERRDLDVIDRGDDYDQHRDPDMDDPLDRLDR